VDTLWQRLDEALLEEFEDVMGVPAEYDPEDEPPTPTFDPLWVQAFAVGDTWDPDKGPFPALLLLSNQMDIDPGQHGSPVGAVDALYDYMAIAVAESATYAGGRNDAQALLYRMRQTLQRWPIILSAAFDAGSREIPQQLALRRARIEMRGRQGSNRGRWLAIAVVQFSVEATEQGDLT
jgi:hypothetical protein